MRCHPSSRSRVMFSFMLMAVTFHFDWGFRRLKTFNALKVRGLGRPGMHSGHIYWVALCGVCSCCPTKWSEELSGGPEHPSTAASDVLVLYGIRCPVNLSQLRPAILKMSPKILPPLPQATRCDSSDSPDSQVYGANMGPTWGRQAPGGLHVGSMNLALWVSMAPHADGTRAARHHQDAEWNSAGVLTLFILIHKNELLFLSQV